MWSEHQRKPSLWVRFFFTLISCCKLLPLLRRAALLRLHLQQTIHTVKCCDNQMLRLIKAFSGVTYIHRLLQAQHEHIAFCRRDPTDAQTRTSPSPLQAFRTLVTPRLCRRSHTHTQHTPFAGDRDNRHSTHTCTRTKPTRAVGSSAAMNASDRKHDHIQYK